MTKKHFEAIAKAVRDHRNSVDNPDAVDMMARNLADVCATSNPRFDRFRFLKACGVV